jgi:hypothetical protein
MPSREAHLQLAARNKEALDYLLRKAEKLPEWIATVAFYRALHLVEALFAHDENEHSHNHEERDQRLKRNRRYANIYKHYRPLWAASVIARYLVDPSGRQFKTFTDYMPPGKLKSELINHRLRRIESSVSRMLGRQLK